MMIEDYRFGSITVEGREYLKDLKIVQGRVMPGWWRKEGHSVDIEDMDDILSAMPDILVVGMGQPGRMQVSESLQRALAEARIRLIEEPTPQAAKTFNQLSEKGLNVAGAFHLTC